LHAADLALWLWMLLVRGESGRAYNVGSDQAVSIRELAEATAREAGVNVEIAKAPNPSVKPPRYVPSVERARRELGLEILIPLPEALRRTLAWLKETAE
jgi:dTDP-glucose 4,6-dehydratase